MMHPAQILGEATAGWLLADLATGAFHWWQDRYGRPEMPLLGRWLIEPNRLHHRDPMAFTRGTLADRSLAAAVAAALVGAAWVWLLGPSVFAAALVIGGALASEVHRLAHQGKRPGALGALQEIGLIQSPAQHARHHRGSFDQRYCVLTDWLNPILDRARVWAWLERIVGRPRERCGE